MPTRKVADPSAETLLRMVKGQNVKAHRQKGKRLAAPRSARSDGALQVCLTPGRGVAQLLIFQMSRCEKPSRGYGGGNLSDGKFGENAPNEGIYGEKR